jgi:hypothetical protein
VPPDQAVKMYDALKAKGVPTALVMFEARRPQPNSGWQSLHLCPALMCLE